MKKEKEINKVQWFKSGKIHKSMNLFFFTLLICFKNFTH